MIKIIKIFFILVILQIGLKAEIRDSLYISVGNKAITKSDIVNEIKLILIMNNQSYSEDRRDELQKLAINQTVKRTIKKIEIEKNDFLRFNIKDLENEITKIANKVSMDVETFKNIFESNELDFSILEDRVKTELLWNSLIYQLYRDRISINKEEIDENLKMIQEKKEMEEFLVSEILLEPIEKDKLKEEYNNLKKRIIEEGFESVARTSSISESSINGGDLGWLKENVISKNLKSKIINLPLGEVSDPILLPNGILFLKVRDKKFTKINLDIESAKDELVSIEKNKILNIYSLTHYDKLRRSVSVKFFE